MVFWSDVVEHRLTDFHVAVPEFSVPAQNGKHGQTIQSDNRSICELHGDSRVTSHLSKVPPVRGMPVSVRTRQLVMRPLDCSVDAGCPGDDCF